MHQAVNTIVRLCAKWRKKMLLTVLEARVEKIPWSFMNHRLIGLLKTHAFVRASPGPEMAS